MAESQTGGLKWWQWGVVVTIIGVLWTGFLAPAVLVAVAKAVLPWLGMVLATVLAAVWVVAIFVDENERAERDRQAIERGERIVYIDAGDL